MVTGFRDEVGTPAEPAGGSSLSNSYPHNNQNHQGGEDRALISLGVVWAGEIRDFFLFLEEKKEEAIEAGEPVEVVIGKRSYALYPTGHRPGKGAPFYRYVLENSGIRFMLSTAVECTDTYPNVLVDLGSLMLMQAGSLEAAWSIVLERLRQLGCVVRSNKLSRVDMCVDLAGVHCSEFSNLVRSRCFASRGRKLKEFGVEIYSESRQDTGFVIGTKIMLRVYDKLKETEHDEVKRAALVALRWGGETPEAATRVEWQLRREQFAEYGGDTVQDYFKLKEGIVSDLCERWFRLTDGEFDTNHSDRSETHPLWKRVTDHFAGCFASVVRTARRSFAKRLKVEGLPRQALGCLVSAVSASIGKVADVGEFLAGAFDLLEAEAEKLGAGELLGRVSARALVFNAALPDQGRKPGREISLKGRQQALGLVGGWAFS